MSEHEKKVGDVDVTIEREMCIGSGACVKVAPELYEIDDESLVAFRADAQDPGEKVVVESAQVCPVEALIVKKNGEQIVP